MSEHKVVDVDEPVTADDIYDFIEYLNEITEEEEEPEEDNG